MSQEFSKDAVKTTTTEEQPGHSRHSGMIVVLAAAVALALAGDGLLLKRVNRFGDQLTVSADATQAQIAKLGDATTSLLEQRLAAINEAISAQAAQVKGAENSANSALKQARAQSTKLEGQLRNQLEDQQQQVTGQIAQLKDATLDASNRIAAFSADVDSVKSGVNGVRTDVASTKDGLERTGTDLKRAIGDMGAMSGLIATNSKDIETLRALGERNYIEFRLNKAQTQQKLGDVVIALRKSDPKHNRYTVDVTADDKVVEKRDRTINEPVQVYVHNSRQPYEIVVNRVNKNEIVGYLSAPKVTLARQ